MYARRLMVLYICVKFHENSRTVSELWSGHEYMVEMAMFNVQWAIAPKSRQPELWFLCSAHRLMVLCFVKISQTVSELWSGHEIIKRRRTDTQYFGRCNIIPRHFLWRGIRS